MFRTNVEDLIFFPLQLLFEKLCSLLNLWHFSAEKELRCAMNFYDVLQNYCLEL